MRRRRTQRRTRRRYRSEHDLHAHHRRFVGADPGRRLCRRAPRPFGIVENTSVLQGGGDAIERYPTAVLAHEIGHVLGGEHEAAKSSTNLMRATINQASFNDANFIPDFSAANANEITSSELLFLSPVTQVPLPATLPALLGGVLLMAGLRRSRAA